MKKVNYKIRILKERANHYMSYQNNFRIQVLDYKFQKVNFFETENKGLGEELESSLEAFDW